MIKTRHSGAKFSAIVGISEQLKARSLTENREYLLLNRGVNAVENIDINKIAREIDFNTVDIQVYPPAKGRIDLRKAIIKTYFQETVNLENVFITSGGVNSLDLIFKTLDINEVVLPEFYWGAYLNILKINKLSYSFYSNLQYLVENAEKFVNKAVLFCDPNNPTGIKFNDEELLNAIQVLDNKGVVVIFDCPYRRLFMDWETDDFYKKLTLFENLIIAESFSKSIGLSGQRIGFVYCKNEVFMNELSVNLLFATNGINNFAQILVHKILTSKDGIEAAFNFRAITVSEIKRNIRYLIDNKLLFEEIYSTTEPLGMFVIINKSYEELLKYQIGSIALNYFTQLPLNNINNYSRICVSVPHLKFKTFFEKIEK